MCPVFQLIYSLFAVEQGHKEDELKELRTKFSSTFKNSFRNNHQIKSPINKDEKLTPNNNFYMQFIQIVVDAIIL